MAISGWVQKNTAMFFRIHLQSLDPSPSGPLAVIPDGHAEGCGVSPHFEKLNCKECIGANFGLRVKSLSCNWSFAFPTRVLLSFPVQAGWRLLISPEKSCADDSPFIALVSLSAASDFRGRQLVRSTWGGVSRVNNRRVRLVFVLGAVQSPSVQSAIEAEAREFEDIIQHEAPEKYVHLTYKLITAVQWLAASCPQAKFMVKVDTDTVLDIQKMGDYLISKETEKNVAVGVLRREIPVERDLSHPNYQDPWTYPHPTYPPYLAGPCYVLSMDLVEKIAAKFSTLPLLSNEDCFVGLSLQVLGVTPQDSAPQAEINAFWGTTDARLKDLRLLTAVHPIPLDKREHFWKAMTQRSNVNHEV
ncbi:beta-1,3-galactosyltransferase 5 [Cyclospora cayetanensis]|uniref:Hexosyltransferase n=1 Tax=Cyclospora cayetanensis TaxID=88456 RepID=A0A6P6RQM6_9EIME|nr:beta-1,3-galactosyltransferase 5 [Cyclospora cayetanensis]